MDNRNAAELPPDLPRDVILFSTADWDHPFWTNKQRVALQLATAGFRVLYVESLGLRHPTATARDIRRVFRRLWRGLRPPRQVHPKLWVCSPVVLPSYRRPWLRALNDRLLLAFIRHWVKRLHFSKPIVWTYNPLVAHIIGSVGASMLVYHAVDDLSAAPGVAGDGLAAAQCELARRADLIFATSPALEGKLARLAPTRTYYLPNVADYDHFAKAQSPGPLPADLESIPRPRIGFIGAVSPYKMDFDLIAAIALRRPDLHWVLIGQVGEGQPLADARQLRLANVHILGPRPYEQLPQYLRGFDVATIPAPRNDYTAAMFPMKFFEYLAAGRPIVASGVPALAAYSHACALVESPAEFEAAIDRLLAGHVPDAGTCQELAKKFTWQWRIGEMLARLELAWRTRRVHKAHGSCGPRGLPGNAHPVQNPPLA